MMARRGPDGIYAGYAGIAGVPAGQESAYCVQKTDDLTSLIVLLAILLKALVTVSGFRMIGTAPVYPRVAAVAVVEIPIRRACNDDGETAAVPRLRSPDRETARHLFPAYRTDIARRFVLHSGQGLPARWNRQSQDGLRHSREITPLCSPRMTSTTLSW